MEAILEKIPISVDFEFAAIIGALKSSSMNEASYSSTIIFPVQESSFNQLKAPLCSYGLPIGRSNTGYPVFGGDLALINAYLGKLTSVLIPF